MEKIYQNIATRYAYFIDTKAFEKLNEVLWENFSMTGAFELRGAENFIASLDQLNQFDATLHRLSNFYIHKINNELINASCYCVASHITNEHSKSANLEMGIIYMDTLEKREGKIKILERNFSLVWQEQRKL